MSIANIVFAGLLAISCADTADDAIVADPTLQAIIAKVPAAESAEALEAVLAELKSSTEGKQHALVAQLLYFSMRGNDVREGMTAGVVIDRLQISKPKLLQGILPYLDTTEPALQRELGNVLSAIDEAPDGEPRDFSLYEGVLRQNRSDPPRALVRHMLDSAPEQARETLTKTLLEDSDRRSAPSSEANLDQLLADQAWWVRYYAATRIVRDPGARTPERLQRLRDDADPTVRSAVADLAR